MQKVTTGMREKVINTMKWIDREEWVKKKNNLGTQGCEHIDTTYKSK